MTPDNLHLAAERADSTETKILLGFLYEHGFQVKRNQKEALRWYLQAVSEGSLLAHYRAASLYSDKELKNESEAFRLCQIAADKEYVPAEFLLGIFYHEGIGTKVDIDRTIYWFDKATNHGSADAACHLGILYKENPGITDLKCAVTYFEKAADLGDGAAAQMLAIMYEDGDDIPQSSEKAIFWYNRACKLGDWLALSSMGIFYDSGELGLPVDKAKAKKLYQRSGKAYNEKLKIKNDLIPGFLEEYEKRQGVLNKRQKKLLTMHGFKPRKERGMKRSYL